MNNKIEELSREAGYEEDMFGIGHWHMQEFRTFVKLILRDCIDICNNHYSMEGIAQNIEKDIKQHFGIE